MKLKCAFSLVLVVGFGWLHATEAPFDSLAWSENVGRSGTNRTVLPINQIITPAGTQVELHGLRPQVLAMSPDGKILITSGKTHDLIVVDPETKKIIQTVALPDDKAMTKMVDAVSSHILKPDQDEQVSFTGLIFSPDGTRIYLSNVKGSIKVFFVDAKHHVKGIGSIALPEANAPERKEEIPAGLAISADGKRLYVAGNLSNRLLEFELPTGRFVRQFDVGVEPYDVVLAGKKAYVSNWGGRRPDASSVTGPAGRGTIVRVDPVRHIANEGSVSVIDLEQGKVTAEIITGLHASALLVTPKGRHVCVANANSDTISVIDTKSDQVIDLISVRWTPQDIFGASPNALAMDAKGKTLYVCHGSQNAIAVIEFNVGKSKMLGLIPTGWYPGALVLDEKRDQLYVANIKGTLPDHSYEPSRRGYNSHQHLGTLSLIELPDKKTLAQHTEVVFKNYRRAVLENAFAPVREGVAPLPVPERIGEPSVIKHVIYLVKENRTYDQVLGDIKAGNGDSKLCVFGEKVTPNQHKMVNEFVLLDNTYCCSILSADGHQWATTAFATDYMEKSFADFPRSYPDMQEAGDLDAMAYSPGGFIWDNALKHGKTVRDYGEGTVAVTSWKDPKNKKPLKFSDYYRDFINHSQLINYSNYAGVASLWPIMMTNTVGWNMDVPDVFRAAQFIKELKQFEAKGELPNLILICLPNDHTSGTSAGSPTPAAQVADGDLAFGQILEAVSHSQFWKDTCVFAIEDDPQAGWDHVSGYRTTAYIASPYAKRHAVVSVNYNQASLVRTMELMLGLPPMNLIDATTTPMRECFTSVPDFTPFNCVTNNVPLNQMNPGLHAINDRRQIRDAIASSRLNLGKPDQCPEDVLNKIIWHAQKGFEEPYPQWAITVGAKDDDDK
jgi:YVTN family beta-propeller protein